MFKAPEAISASISHTNAHTETLCVLFETVHMYMITLLRVRAYEKSKLLNNYMRFCFSLFLFLFLPSSHSHSVSITHSHLVFGFGVPCARLLSNVEQIIFERRTLHLIHFNSVRSFVFVKRWNASLAKTKIRIIMELKTFVSIR